MRLEKEVEICFALGGIVYTLPDFSYLKICPGFANFRGAERALCVM